MNARKWIILVSDWLWFWPSSKFCSFTKINNSLYIRFDRLTSQNKMRNCISTRCSHYSCQWNQKYWLLIRPHLTRSHLFRKPKTVKPRQFRNNNIVNIETRKDSFPATEEWDSPFSCIPVTLGMMEDIIWKWFVVRKTNCIRGVGIINVKVVQNVSCSDFRGWLLATLSSCCRLWP